MDNCLSASEISSAVGLGKSTAVFEIQKVVSRINAKEQHLRAWSHFNEEVPLTHAGIIDKKLNKGKMAGVGIGVKDIIDTKHFLTENGLVADEGRQPRNNATVVDRLIAEDAIVVGKTKTTECAFQTPTDTRNPHDFNRTPGGSSSGSAAAVGSGTIPVALGTQTVGSVIRPASFCGVWAIKPSWGLIPRTGVLQLSHLFDHIGVFGRSPEDLAMIVDILSGDDGIDPASQGILPSNLASAVANNSLVRPDIAILRDYAWPQLEDSSKEQFDQLAVELSASIIDMPALYNDVFRIAQEVLAQDMAHNLGDRFHSGANLLSNNLREWIVKGLCLNSKTYLANIEALQKMRVSFNALMDNFDFAIAPATSGEAPVGLQSTGSPNFCLLWTSIGVPVVNIPIFTGPNGMPVGVQVIGRNGSDAETLSAAVWLRKKLNVRMVY